jgi:hypothetical protein
MLNLGQIVYDVTNNRPLFFCGLEVMSSKKGKECKCFTLTEFIDENGNLLKYDGRTAPVPFEYINFTKDGKPYSGTAIAELSCGGHFFGIIDGTVNQVKEAAVKAIQNMKTVMIEHGVNIEEVTHEGGRKYSKVTIGNKVIEKPQQLAISSIPQ